MASKLELFVGNTKPFDVVIGSSLISSDRASLTVLDSIGGTVVLQRDTVAGNMSIDVGNMKLTSTLTGIEADALIPGKYIGQAGVRFGNDDTWQYTQPFHVEIKASIVAKV